jgi:Holliday junction resolvase YEN1
LPYHVAPGEAEAECALLQREGIVDAVLSEDVDTIMFGSGITMRNWSAEGKGKVPTHINVYDSVKIKNGQARLDREGMILIAMMSGGDYIPEGIPGCGPKTACEAARAGFGAKLCKIERGDKKGFEEWKSELAHELRSNESKFFRTKHGSLQIPESFPNREILRYYTHPAISSLDNIRELGSSIVWEKPMDLPALRKFTEEAFKWETVIGAKKFIRTLAPGLLVRELRLGSEGRKAQLVQKIHQAREHASTDNTPELRISYIPIDVVNIDLSIERPEENDAEGPEDGEEQEANEDVPSSTQQRPYLFDPTEVTKLWIFDHFVEIGAKQKYDEWTAMQTAKAAKIATVAARKPRAPAPKKGTDGSMPKGAIHQFAKVTKSIAQPSDKSNDAVNARHDLPFPDLPASSYSNRQLGPFRSSKTTFHAKSLQTIDLTSSSSPIRSPAEPPSTIVVTEHVESNVSNAVNRRRRSPLQRARTEGSNALRADTLDLSTKMPTAPTRREPLSRAKAASKRQANSPLGTPKAAKKTSMTIPKPMSVNSSPMRQDQITQYFSPSRVSRQADMVDLSNSSPSRPCRTNAFHPPSVAGRNSLGQQAVERSSPIQVWVSDCESSHVPSTAVTNNEINQSRAPLTSTARLSASSITHTLTSNISNTSNTIAVHTVDLTSPLPHRSRGKINSTFTVSKSVASTTTTKSTTTSDKMSSRGRLETCDANRQRVRVRESLKGSFAIEDETPKASGRSKASKGTWSLQEVSVLDLTGDS